MKDQIINIVKDVLTSYRLSDDDMNEILDAINKSENINIGKELDNAIIEAPRAYMDRMLPVLNETMVNAFLNNFTPDGDVPLYSGIIIASDLLKAADQCKIIYDDKKEFKRLLNKYPEWLLNNNTYLFNNPFMGTNSYKQS